MSTNQNNLCSRTIQIELCFFLNSEGVIPVSLLKTLLKAVFDFLPMGPEAREGQGFFDICLGTIGS
jgi:hypothetical protein